MKLDREIGALLKYKKKVKLDTEIGALNKSESKIIFENLSLA